MKWLLTGRALIVSVGEGTALCGPHRQRDAPVHYITHRKLPGRAVALTNGWKVGIVLPGLRLGAEEVRERREEHVRAPDLADLVGRHDDAYVDVRVKVTCPEGEGASADAERADEVVLDEILHVLQHRHARVDLGVADKLWGE